MSMGWALCWELWARQRGLLGVLAAYLALAIFVVLVLPEWIVGTILHPNPDVVGWLLLPVMGGLVVIIAGLCRGEEGRWEGAASAVSSRLFVLPLSAKALVGWSMLAGAVPMGLLWPVFAVANLWLTGTQLPLLWPSLLLCNAVSWGQTLNYLPLGVPYLRLWLFGLGMPGLVIACCSAADSGVPELILAILLVGMLVAAFSLSVVGVEQARHGTGSDWMMWHRWTLSTPTARYKPFVSPEQALFWMEWRLHRWKFWLVAGMVLLPLFLFLYMANRVVENTPLIEAAGLAPALAALGPGWLVLVGLIWVPVTFGLVGGDGEWVTPKSSGMPTTFVLVRPVSTATLVAAKFSMCARGALLGGALIVAIALGWALPTGHWVEMSDRLVTVSGSGWAAILVLVIGLAAGYAITWGHMIAGLWVGLTGRPWVLGGTALVGTAGAGGFGYVLAQLLTEPTWRTEVALRLPSVMAWAIGFKVVLTTLALWGIVRRKLVPGRAILLALFGWLMAAVGLFAALAWLVPVELVTHFNLAQGVALMLPLARVGLAPLALDWNRHR